MRSPNRYVPLSVDPADRVVPSTQRSPPAHLIKGHAGYGVESDRTWDSGVWLQVSVGRVDTGARYTSHVRLSFPRARREGKETRDPPPPSSELVMRFAHVMQLPRVQAAPTSRPLLAASAVWDAFF